MKMDIHELLETPLPSDNAVELMELISESEAWGDRIASRMKTAEVQLSRERSMFDIMWDNSIAQNSKMKVAAMEARARADTATQREKVEELEAEIRHLKRLNSIIENRCSVGQSFLSNISAMIRAGINLN